MAGLPSMSSFLIRGLKPYKPVDKSEGCTICTIPWRKHARKIVSLPCRHYYHKSCIRRWIKDGPGPLATCPYCRSGLCSRPSEIIYEPRIAPVHVPIDQGVDEAWAEERFARASRDLQDDLDYIQRITVLLCESQSRIVGAQWARMLMETLAAYGEARTVPRTGVGRYVIIRSILEALQATWREMGVNTTDIEEAVEAFNEYEEHAETRNITDVYANLGLSELAATETNLGDAGGDSDEPDMIFSLYAAWERNFDVETSVEGEAGYEAGEENEEGEGEGEAEEALRDESMNRWFTVCSGVENGEIDYP